MKNTVLTGADLLQRRGNDLLKGKRFALLTNPTGINSQFQSIIDICAGIEQGKLAAFFACEHGLRNEYQAGVLFEDGIDNVYNIPIYSLYGKNRKPTAEMLKDIDVVVFDIQDLGVRFYTYLTTLIYVMEACAEHQVGLLVLDRPNPLGGYGVEGGYLDENFKSMVGAWRMPARTGMTIGEFARLINAQMSKSCDLEVLALEGWDRTMDYSDTGLPWVMPSPNMPTMDTVRVYVGNCLFEGTNLSEGRGTTKPFEIVGAPWLDHRAVCDAMNAMALPGVWFQPLTFTPTFQKHQGVLCQGVMTYVTDPARFHSAEAGLHLLHQIMMLHPDHFEWIQPSQEGGHYFIDILTGSDVVRTTLHQPGAIDSILASWQRDSEDWKKMRKPFLLYDEKEG